MNLKAITLILAISVSFIGTGQTYNRGKKNIGLTAGGYYNITNYNKKLFSGAGGSSYNIGLASQIGNAIYPSLIYKYNSVTLDPVQEFIMPADIDFHSISLPVTLKIPFWGIYIGKSKKYECKGVDLALIIGGEYAYNFGTDNSFNAQFKNDFYFLSGLELLPSKSGSSRQNKRWSYHIDILYKYAFTKHANWLNKSFSTHQVGIQFSVIKHQIIKFSNM